jgi:hypothetical protein
MTDRKKPGVAFWATVVAALSPLLYLLSIGHACWFTSRTEVGIDALNRIYQPVMRLYWGGNVPSGEEPLEQYARCFASTRRQWYLRFDTQRRAYVWSAR